MKKRIAFLLACLICIGTLSTGCGVSKQEEDNNDGNTVTFFAPLSGNLSNVVKDFGETPIAQEWSKRTGINVKYIHPTNNDQFNLMLASRDLPDIVEHIWINYPGGPSKAIKDNLILKLNDIIDEKSPNLKKFLSENSDVEKQLKTDDGELYVYPLVRSDEMLLTTTGPVIRKDWLEDLNLEVPETISEWENMLRAFKNEKGAQTPLVVKSMTDMYEYGAFLGAYGVIKGFFIDDNGKVQYGAVTPEYKEFLKTMNKWYEEGLLDNNFTGSDSKMVDSSILNGKAGATVGALGGGIGKWLNSKPDDKYDLVGAPWPVLNKGERHKFSSRQNKVSGYGAAISTNCKNVDAAAKLLDYVYSDEGIMLMNFGIENVSYKMENGYPKYTELITNNPDGQSMAVALAQYARSGSSGAFVQDRRYLEQYAGLPQQQDAIKKWMDTDAEKHVLPPLTPKEEESNVISSFLSNANTLVEEMTVKLIMGQTDFEKWDSYVENVKKAGLSEALAVYQNALDRYNNR